MKKGKKNSSKVVMNPSWFPPQGDLAQFPEEQFSERGA